MGSTRLKINYDGQNIVLGKIQQCVLAAIDSGSGTLANINRTVEEILNKDRREIPLSTSYQSINSLINKGFVTSQVLLSNKKRYNITKAGKEILSIVSKKNSRLQESFTVFKPDVVFRKKTDVVTVDSLPICDKTKIKQLLNVIINELLSLQIQCEEMISDENLMLDESKWGASKKKIKKNFDILRNNKYFHCQEIKDLIKSSRFKINQASAKKALRNPKKILNSLQKVSENLDEVFRK